MCDSGRIKFPLRFQSSTKSVTCSISPNGSENQPLSVIFFLYAHVFPWKTNAIKQLLRLNLLSTKNGRDWLPLQASCVCKQEPPSGWQTPADYSTAGLLEWIVYRGHSIGEQKHAKAKKSHVQRAGISLSTMTQQPLNLFNTRRLQPERVLCSSRELSTAKYLLCCSALQSQSLRRFFSHGSGFSSWADTSATKEHQWLFCRLINHKAAI